MASNPLYEALTGLVAEMRKEAHQQWREAFDTYNETGILKRYTADDVQRVIQKWADRLAEAALAAAVPAPPQEEEGRPSEGAYDVANEIADRDVIWSRRDFDHEAAAVRIDAYAKRQALPAPPAVPKLYKGHIDPDCEVARGVGGYCTCETPEEKAERKREADEIEAEHDRFASSLVPPAVPVCDCGEKLTCCVSCAVSDWQGQHPECPTCCPPAVPCETCPGCKTNPRGQSSPYCLDCYMRFSKPAPPSALLGGLEDREGHEGK